MTFSLGFGDVCEDETKIYELRTFFKCRQCMERIDRGVRLTIPGEPDIFQCVVDDIESCNLRLYAE